jgi:hypothetical protein
MVCYILYGGVLALCFASFWVWRSTVEVLASYYYGKHDWFAVIYLVAVLVVGLALFAGAVASESYLRRAIELPPVQARQAPGRGPMKRLVRRFARVVGWLLAALVVAVALQEWTYRQAGL